MGLPGLDTGRFDPDLIEATDDFATVLAATATAGAALVEPSHVLVALAGLRRGATGTLFAAAGIPVDVFVEALRHGADPAAEVPFECTDRTISTATRSALAELAAGPPDRTLDERAVLAVLLRHLEPAAHDLLVEHGGVDLAAWSTAATATPAVPAGVIGRDGAPDPAAFTAAARTVLATLATESAALGQRSPGTVTLLHAMASAPRGLLAQAAPMLRFDLRDLRARTLTLLRGRPGRPVAPIDVDPGRIGPALRLALERAAAGAAARGAARVGERDLLSALLDATGGPVAAQLTAVGVDVAGLRHYADQVHVEVDDADEADPDAPGHPRAEPSVTESLDRLRSSLLGQEAVVERLLPRVELIKRAARRGFRMGERPLATFLFCGPSGTGKTMTARLLATVIYGSADDVITFEMGQFNSRHSINNFIGAPPGYVGFGEGQLTNGLAHHPRSVLLFDEVEKAHPLVLDALLRLLDEGRVNDPAGPVRDARDAVVVLTSNLGAAEFAELGRLRHRGAGGAGTPLLRRAVRMMLAVPDDDYDGEGDEPGAEVGPGEAGVAAHLRQVLEGFFRPEFLNRIDETVLFAPFGVPELEAIAAAGLRRRAEDLSTSLGVRLTWDPDVPGHIVDDVTRWRLDEAARGVNRCVDAVLHLVLRAMDDAEELGEQLDTIHVVARDGRLAVARG